MKNLSIQEIKNLIHGKDKIKFFKIIFLFLMSIIFAYLLFSGETENNITSLPKNIIKIKCKLLIDPEFKGEILLINEKNSTIFEDFQFKQVVDQIDANYSSCLIFGPIGKLNTFWNEQYIVTTKDTNTSSLQQKRANYDLSF